MKGADWRGLATGEPELVGNRSESGPNVGQWPFRVCLRGPSAGTRTYSGVALRRGLEMVHLQRVDRPLSARRLPRPPTLHVAELAHQDRDRWRASQAGGH